MRKPPGALNTERLYISHIHPSSRYHDDGSVTSGQETTE